MRAIFEKLGNNRGNTIIITILVMLILVSLGAVFAVLSIGEYNTSERQRRAIQALYIAEAGVERAIYDLRQDFVADLTSPSFTDGDINIYNIGPDTGNFYTIPYSSTALNGGTFTVQLKNVAGLTNEIWIQSSGTIGDETQTVLAYVRVENSSIWNNAIFAGAGAAGAMVNGNVNISGSVHILGEGLSSSDYVINLGGTAELVRNNYTGMPASLLAKVPALPTRIFGGETVSTLSATLRVKRGIVGLSGSSQVGETNVTGNTVKETVDGAYVTDGYGGNKGTANVHSDNGWSNGYDLGDTVTFPSLSDPYPGYSTYQQYLRANALVITDAAKLAVLNSLTPGSNFNYSDANGSISMDGSGNLAISGIVYIDGGGFSTSGGGITYTGKGSILATGDVQIDTNFVTNGNNSFPTNMIGIMTPGSIGFNAANIDVMGLFYGETQITSQKQTDVVGSFVSNFFDMGSNVPAIYQVPAAASSLPPGMIGGGAGYSLNVVSWQKL